MGGKGGGGHDSSVRAAEDGFRSAVERQLTILTNLGGIPHGQAVDILLNRIRGDDTPEPKSEEIRHVMIQLKCTHEDAVKALVVKAAMLGLQATGYDTVQSTHILIDRLNQTRNDGLKQQQQDGIGAVRSSGGMGQNAGGGGGGGGGSGVYDSTGQLTSAQEERTDPQRAKQQQQQQQEDQDEHDEQRRQREIKEEQRHQLSLLQEEEEFLHQQQRVVQVEGEHGKQQQQQQQQQQQHGRHSTTITTKGLRNKVPSETNLVGGVGNSGGGGGGNTSGGRLGNITSLIGRGSSRKRPLSMTTDESVTSVTAMQDVRMAMKVASANDDDVCNMLDGDGDDEMVDVCLPPDHKRIRINTTAVDRYSPLLHHGNTSHTSHGGQHQTQHHHFTNSNFGIVNNNGNNNISSSGNTDNDSSNIAGGGGGGGGGGGMATVWPFPHTAALHHHEQFQNVNFIPHIHHANNNNAIFSNSATTITTTSNLTTNSGNGVVGQAGNHHHHGHHSHHNMQMVVSPRQGRAEMRSRSPNSYTDDAHMGKRPRHL